MKRRFKPMILVALGTAAAATTAVAIAVAGTNALRTPNKSSISRSLRAATLSARGVRVMNVTSGSRALLRDLNEEGGLYRLAKTRDRAFYRFHRKPASLEDGRTCFSVGRVSRFADIGSSSCTNVFPAVQTPVLDLSVVEGDAGVKKAHWFRAEGFAVDQIAKIGLLDSDGSVVATAPVVANTFEFLPTPHVAAGGIVGYDVTGNVVFKSKY